MKIDVTLYWTTPPPEPSPKLYKWVGKVRNGWKPNARIRSMGYHESAEFFEVYIWEWLNVLWPAMRGELEFPDEPG